MKTPICSFDAKTGVLCSNCESKLKSGAITQDDIDASIKLTKIAERSQDVNKFSLIKAVRAEGDVVLVFKNSDLTILRSSEILTTQIEKEFQSKVWPVEAESSDRRFIENLFYPAKVLNVNLFWLPDGNRLTKVLVLQAFSPQADESFNRTRAYQNQDVGTIRAAAVNVERIAKIAKTVRNLELLVEFQKS